MLRKSLIAFTAATVVCVGSIVSVQLRATVTREARVPANQVNIKPDGGTLTLTESNKGLQWNYIGPRNP